jgi:hypothetical protein
MLAQSHINHKWQNCSCKNQIVTVVVNVLVTYWPFSSSDGVLKMEEIDLGEKRHGTMCGKLQ